MFMAKATITLPDDLLNQLSRLGDRTDEIIDSCLEAGGDVALSIVRNSLESVVGKNTKHPSRSTGELVRSLGVSPPKLNRKGDKDVKIGFNEPRKDGKASNALIATVLEYGKSGQPPKPFMKQAQSKAKAPVIKAIQDKFDEEVGKL